MRLTQGETSGEELLSPAISEWPLLRAATGQDQVDAINQRLSAGIGTAVIRMRTEHTTISGQQADVVPDRLAFLGCETIFGSRLRLGEPRGNASQPLAVGV